jgi:molybdopterin-biosynthesis enzyme MoeA-like protein
MGRLNIGALIIGDEILRGKRSDKHFPRLVETLAARGLCLSWSLSIGDDRQRLTETLRRTLAASDVVFSFGGIGITPDDHTRHAAAAAAGVELRLHPDAEREIRARCAEQGSEVTPQRLQLGEFPVGSRIVPNPVNRMPGFSFGDHHFYPGFPQMAWPMLEWTLDTYYSAYFHVMPESEAAIIVWEGREGDLLSLMQNIEMRYSGLIVFSLPSLGDAGRRPHIELGVRGEPAQVAVAMDDIRAAVTRQGYAWEPL